ncbi:MAG: hypothetical protein AAGF96_03075 [Bacteroidota bacterium]
MKTWDQFFKKSSGQRNSWLTKFTLSLLVGLVLSTIGCTNDDNGGSFDNGKPISNEAEAREVFDALLTFFSAYAADLPATELGETIDTSFEGLSGSATVRYSRQVRSQSSSFGTTSSDLISTFITFQNFEPDWVAMRITGPVAFFWARSSRSRSTGFVSSDSRAITTWPANTEPIEFIEIAFRLSDGTWINDVIQVDASSPDWTDRWTRVEITTESGELFSL